MSAHPWPWQFREQNGDVTDATGECVITALFPDEFEAIQAMRAEAYASGYAAGQEAMRKAAADTCETVARRNYSNGAAWSGAQDCRHAVTALSITRDAQEPPR